MQEKPTRHSTLETRHADGIRMMVAWTDLAGTYCNALAENRVSERGSEIRRSHQDIIRIASLYRDRYESWSHWIADEVQLEGRDASLDSLVRSKSVLDFNTGELTDETSEYDWSVAVSRLMLHLRFAVPLLISVLAQRRRSEITANLTAIDTQLRRAMESSLMDSGIEFAGVFRPGKWLNFTASKSDFRYYDGERMATDHRSKPPIAMGSQEESRGDKSWSLINVLFATNREKTNSKDPKKLFENSRSTKGVHYGVGKVSVPADRRMGTLPAPRWWKLEFRADPKKHVILRSATTVNEAVFRAAARASVEDAGEKSAFVFIHGYNVSFEGAMRRTGQIAYDLNFSGVPCCFTWASRGETEDYAADTASIEWTTPMLKSFISAFADYSGVEKLHIIAHSMGNRALAKALSLIGAERKSEAPIVQEVVLAAPDIDTGVFLNLVEAMKSSAQRLTLYASSNDKAIKAARKIYGFARAGLSGKDLVLVEGVDTVDASNVNTGFLKHSYYGDNRSVIADIFQILKTSAVPDARPGLRRISGGGHRSLGVS